MVKFKLLWPLQRQRASPAADITAVIRLPSGALTKASIEDIQALRSRALGAEGFSEEWAVTKYAEFFATSSAAYRAVTARMNAVRSAPLVIYQQGADGALEPVGEQHPVQQLLDFVNPWWTSADLLAATEMYLCLWGSAFWLIDRSEPGRPTIWPLRSDRMRIVPGKTRQDYIAGYLYEEGGRKVALLPEEIVWFRYINPLDEFAGLSPVAAGRLSLEMGRNALKFNNSFFTEGVNPGDLVFLSKGPLTDEQVAEFYERLDQRFKGPVKGHRPLIVGEGEVQKLGMSQRDMEFLGTLNFTIEEAARIWGVPPQVLMSQASPTYNNTKESWIHFYTSTVSEEWSFFEMEVTEMLLPILGAVGLVARFDRSNVMPLQEARREGDLADLEKIKVGALTINEYRNARNLPPVAWGDEWQRPTVGGFGQIDSDPMDDLGRSAKAYGEDFIAKAMGQHLRRFDALERRFRREQQALFERQRRAVMERLRESGPPFAKQSGGVIFDPIEWNATFAGTGRGLITQILVAAANAQVADFNLGPFDARKDALRAWVNDRAEFWAQRVNEETAKLITAEIAEAIEAGEGIPQMQQRMEKVFKFNNTVRSEMIARTETLTAVNKGYLESYAQSGVVGQMMWLTTIDGRERDAHREADRQVVALGTKFLVGGEALDAPGIGGSAGNVINCRCATIPIVRRLYGERGLNGDKLSANGTHQKTIKTIIRNEAGIPIQVVEETIDA